MAKTKARKIIQVSIDRRYVAGYRKRPEEPDWAAASVKLLSKRLPEEKW